MAVLIYFVHYIHGSTDLIFRTLYPWLYEVFARIYALHKITIALKFVLHKSKIAANLSNRVKFMSYINQKFWEEVHRGATGNLRGSLTEQRDSETLAILLFYYSTFFFHLLNFYLNLSLAFK